MSIRIHEIGSPTIIETASHTHETTLGKGKSVPNVPQNDLFDEEYEDEYGYAEHIQGISKGIFLISY